MPNMGMLLVDDEEDNLGLLIQWLIALGYDVGRASNGDDAMFKARNSGPDRCV
jgi:CheY-like chemotaxis protein